MTPDAASSPVNKTAPHRSVRRGILALILAFVAWTAVMFSYRAGPSVTLPDGVRITYITASKGVLLSSGPNPSPSEFKQYRHSVPRDELRIQQWWRKMLDELPRWVASRLPAWEIHHDNYPDWPDSHELELQFRVEGTLNHRPWHIFIADESGWETRVHEYTWGDDGRFERGAAHHSGWLRLGYAFPRHCKTLRLRFHPAEETEPKLSLVERRTTFTEMVLKNPFYEGPATANGSTPPLKQPFRGGFITLEQLSRDAVVGKDYGWLTAVISLENNGRPREGYDASNFEITDSSGQVFPRTAGSSGSKAGRYTERADTAPWSDDPCWKLRFKLYRRHYCQEAGDNEAFSFENLPVPTDNEVQLNRELTRNGITLRLTTLISLPNPYSGARITVEGWTNEDRLHRLIVIHKAHDEQGRTGVSWSPGAGPSPLVWGPVAGKAKSTTFAVHLPADARSWDLSLIPETVTEVEFTVQSPPVK